MFLSYPIIVNHSTISLQFNIYLFAFLLTNLPVHKSLLLLICCHTFFMIYILTSIGFSRLFSLVFYLLINYHTFTKKSNRVGGKIK